MLTKPLYGVDMEYSIRHLVKFIGSFKYKTSDKYADFYILKRKRKNDQKEIYYRHVMGGSNYLRADNFIRLESTKEWLKTYFGQEILDIILKDK